jgi:dephospho-CoA kinase
MILGLTGTNGSGKGTVAKYLVQKGFKHLSMSAVIAEEIKRRGLSLSRPNYDAVGIDMRRTHGPACIIERRYNEALQLGGDVVIEAIREVAAADFLKKHNIPLIAVDADRKIRYERIVKRNSSKDHIDFDTFVAQEEAEWNNADPNMQDVIGVVKRADHTVHNNGTREELHAQVDKILEEIRVR